MSCDVAAAAFLFLASAQPAPHQPLILVDAPAGAVAATPAPPTSVASEPLFANIIQQAAKLKADTDGYRKRLGKASGASIALPKFDDFQARIAALSALDLQGNQELAKRGTDGDLKCILRGISQDLPKKLADLTGAKTAPDQDTALRDMSYLLNDNVEVITAPPAPPV
ncbi:MAG TPA: hypothetical protein VMU59_01945 [Caulobacteraceae bacterium]|nr:hypothetical protein [Caulobacteraceae bacterium]